MVRVYRNYSLCASHHSVEARANVNGNLLKFRNTASEKIYILVNMMVLKDCRESLTSKISQILSGCTQRR